jgi:hypothetical protein
MVKATRFLLFSRKNPSAHCRESCVRPMARKERYGEEKNVLPLTVFIPRTFPLAESIGRIKDEFGMCGWK